MISFYIRTFAIQLLCTILAAMNTGCHKSADNASSSKSETTLAAAAPNHATGQGSGSSPALRDPRGANAQAPAQFTIKFETTKGEVLVDVYRDWAPRGADRMYNLVKAGYFDNVAFFRVISGFMAQIGIHGEPSVSAVWREQRIADDPVVQSNTRGMVSFATAGKGTRTTQFFFNYNDNSRLDAMGFAPCGKARDMKAIDALYSGYGEGAPGGKGPSQGRVQAEGNAYLKAEFPKLDYILRASVIE
jgi:peptidyl-prolyl cis-trans isomerase A (cyclophilin A)